MHNCLVTVFCLAYNHEKYIRKTFEGFIKQNTSFRFKVLVHDDASTDSTPEIIREYIEKYPNIFEAIFQKENKYQKGIDIEDEYILPMIKTKYVAVCECDDYWTDPSKLQLQVDYMESHPDCSMCVHNTEQIFETGEPAGVFFNTSRKPKDYTMNDLILSEPSAYFHFSSLMWRHDLMKRKNDAFRMDGIGDYPQALYLATKGYIHYIPRVMSRYRLNSIGSWSSMMQSDNKNKIRQHTNMMNGFKTIDLYTQHKYAPAIKKAIARESAKIMLLKDDYASLIKSPRCMVAFSKTMTHKAFRKVYMKYRAVRG